MSLSLAPVRSTVLCAPAHYLFYLKFLLSCLHQRFVRPSGNFYPKFMKGNEELEDYSEILIFSMKVWVQD